MLAAVNAKSGDILWRQTLEKSPRGDIKLLYVNSNQKSVSMHNSNNAGSDIITVSGYNPALVRNWNGNSGNIQSEWFLTPIAPEKAEKSFWFYYENYIYQVIPVWGSHLEVTAYHPFTGQQKKTTTSKINTPWIAKDICVLSEPFFACVINDKLFGIDLTSENPEIKSKTVTPQKPGSLKAVRGLEGAVLVDNEIISLKNLQTLQKTESSIVFNEKFITNENILLQGVVRDDKLQITATNVDSGEAFPDINFVTVYPNTYGTPEIRALKCKTKTDGQPLACRILLTSDDGAVFLIQQGKIKWTREEALTNIAAVEMIDLPLSDSEGAIEEELNSKEGKYFFSF